MASREGAGTSRFGRRAALGGGAAVAGGLALAACGGSGGSSNGSKKLTLMCLGPSPQTVDYVTKQMLPAFADSSGYSVELQQSDWGSGFQKVVTAAASGTLADVIMIGGIWTAALASKNALLTLDDRLSSWPDRAQLYPTMLQDCQYQGKTYALPLYSDTRTTIYRKDLLAKAGITTKELPTSWDEFRTVAQQVADARPTGLQSPVDWGIDKSIGLQQTFAQLLFQAGGTYYAQDGKANFNSSQGIQALDYLTSFYRDRLADVNMVNQGTGASPIVSGAAAMTFSGLNTFQNAAQNAPKITDQLVAGEPLAAKAGGKPATSAWINKIAISAKTKDPDGAWALVRQLAGAPVMSRLDELYGGLPARKDLADASFMTSIDPNLSRASAFIVPQPPNPNMLTIAPQINTLLQQAVRTPGNSAAILGQIDDKIDQINGG